MAEIPKTVLLMILDGWGYREDNKDNAINQANTPNWDRLWNDHSHTLLNASGEVVGLPLGQMGNSEVGHVNIGAGRVIYQELARINKDIESGSFYNNATLDKAVETAVTHEKAVHIMGLLSPGGVHSHENHILEMIRLAYRQGAQKIYLHAFLDGRDTAPKSALESLKKADSLFKELDVGHIASICGRFYAMDRDNRWDRIEKAYDLLTLNKADYHFNDVDDALNAAYQRDETDEFVSPTTIGNPVKINDGDAVIFMNFRSDRARELSYALTDPEFTGFKRQTWPKIQLTTLTQYALDINAQVAYPHTLIENSLGEYLAKIGKKQLRIAETEKYAHVTFFFNGGIEKVFPNEDRILIPSPKVQTYDLKPEMSAFEVTDELVKAINAKKYDVIICNFANADMVGHTGKMKQAIKACEALDQCIGLIDTAIQNTDSEMFITADHGNADIMKNEETNMPHTAHTTSLVPALLVSYLRSFEPTHNEGKLSDIAPTILSLLNIEIPTEMTGSVLFKQQL